MAEDEKKKVKVKFKVTRNRMITAGFIISGVVIAYLYALYVPKPVYSVDYRDTGVILNFRVDLREADKIPVDPGPDQVYTEIVNPLVKNITIVYKPTGNETEDRYYAIEAFEITEKMKLGLYARKITDVGIDAKPLSYFNRTTYDNLPGKIQHPLIAIVHPIYGNQTRVVSAPGHVVYIEATSYRDLDLAVVKFLISALRIKF
ncbi:MAG TPA: hypothetical protein VJJ76_03420 [archaeon]|nr:hypothetical protein [archaeon]